MLTWHRRLGDDLTFRWTWFFLTTILHIGLFLFIHTAAPLQHHKVLQDDLYSSLHLWSDLWPVFSTCHLKLADTHKASVIVCLPELSLDCRFVLQKIWGERVWCVTFVWHFAKYIYCTYMVEKQELLPQGAALPKCVIAGYT